MNTRLWFPLFDVLDHAEHATGSDSLGAPDTGLCLLVDTTSGVTIRSHPAGADPVPAPVAAVHIDGDMSRLPASPLRLPLTHPPAAGQTQPASWPADQHRAGPNEAAPSLLERLRRAAADGAAWFTVDLPVNGTPRARVEHTRVTNQLPTGVDWVNAWVAADDPRCYDDGPYPAQVAHDYRRPDGSVYARFSLDAVRRIAADQQHAPHQPRIGMPIHVVDAQVRHRQPHRLGHGHGHLIPAGRDGWWHLDDPPWRWLPSEITPDSDIWQPLFDSVRGPAGWRRRCTVCDAIDDIDDDQVSGYGVVSRGWYGVNSRTHE